MGSAAARLPRIETYRNASQRAPPSTRPPLAPGFRRTRALSARSPGRTHPEVQRLAQTVQDFGSFTELGDPLEQERAVSQSAAASACRPLESIRGHNAHWALISGDTVTAREPSFRPALRGHFSSGLDELLPRGPQVAGRFVEGRARRLVAARQGRPAPAADLLARIGDHHGVGLVAAARDLRPAGWLAVRDGGVSDGETVRR